MGSSLRWVRARRLALAGTAVAGTLALAAGAAPAGASVGKTIEKTVTATYSCSASALGKTYTYTGSIVVAGTTPAKVAPKSKVTMTGFQTTVTVPASIVNQVIKYTKTISGTLKTFDVVSTDTTGTVNAAGTGIKFGPLTLVANKPLVVKLPGTAKSISGWIAGTTGTMVFSTGKVAITLSVLGISVPVNCTPKPAAVISKSAA